MSALETAGAMRNGEICGICLIKRGSDEDRLLNDPWTTHQYKVHVEPHDAFHRSCLVKWLEKNPNCPFCREYIDITPHLSLKERIIRSINLREISLMDAAAAVGALAAVGAGAGVAAAVGAGAVVGGAPTAVEAVVGVVGVVAAGATVAGVAARAGVAVALAVVVVVAAAATGAATGAAAVAAVAAGVGAVFL